MVKFSKSERLCSRKTIEKLFTRGNSLYLYPFRLVWLEAESEIPGRIRFAVSVPRKRIKLAVNRNRLKRLIREAYRLNRDIIYESLALQNRKIDMMVLYVSPEILDFETVNAKFRELLHQFILNNETDKENI
jgi:ribonuclease P protein component